MLCSMIADFEDLPTKVLADARNRGVRAHPQAQVAEAVELGQRQFLPARGAASVRHFVNRDGREHRTPGAALDPPCTSIHSPGLSSANCSRLPVRSKPWSVLSRKAM